MDDRTRAPALEPARFTTNCRGCGTPIRSGEPALPRPRSGALTCATCASAEPRPQARPDGRPEAA